MGHAKSGKVGGEEKNCYNLIEEQSKNNVTKDTPSHLTQCVSNF